MKLSKIFGLALVGVLALHWSSCSNEIEIFAPENDVTLVYGLLDADSTTHKFKINRVFQGEDAVNVLAQDPSLSEYTNLFAELVEYSKSGNSIVPTGASWTLNEALVTTKDSGFFYYPTQKIYECQANLNSANLYQIRVDKQDGSPVVESTTELITKTGDILLKPQGLGIIGLSLANPDGPLEELTLEMKMPVKAKIIEVYLDFTWRDEYVDGGISDYKTISYKVGTYRTVNVATSPDQNVKITAIFNPISFYEFIAGNVPVVQPGDNIKQRVANQEGLDNKPLKFRFVVGGVELSTYIEVASPSTSILETKPEYTNITNGTGLLSCRTFDNIDSKMSPFSWDYLVEGEITAGRNFCHISSTHAQSCY